MSKLRDGIIRLFGGQATSNPSAVGAGTPRSHLPEAMPAPKSNQSSAEADAARAERLFTEGQRLLYQQGNVRNALPLFAEAADLYKRLVLEEKRRGLARQYGFAAAGRAQCMVAMGKVQEGMLEFEALVKNVRSIAETGSFEMRQPLAEFLTTKGGFYLQFGQHDMAEQDFAEAIGILESLLNPSANDYSVDGQTVHCIIADPTPARFIEGELARARRDQSKVRLLKGDIASAVALIDKATSVLTVLAAEPSPGDNFQDICKDELGRCLVAKAEVLQRANRAADAKRTCRTALGLIESRNDAVAVELRRAITQALGKLEGF